MNRGTNRAKILLTALWFGLTTGLAEVLYQLLRKTIFGSPLFLGGQFVWMVPLFYSLLFICVGILFVLLSRFWPRYFTWRLSIFVYSFLGFFSLLVLLPWLHWLAALLLAAGLASQTAYLLAKYPQIIFSPYKFIKTITRRQGGEGSISENNPAEMEFGLSRRNFLLGVSAVLAGLIVAEQGTKKLSEWAAMINLPAASPGPPNVLLVIWDTVRAQNTGMHGYHRKTTPILDNFSQRGVQFKCAFSTSNWTLPSHASMFTGRWHHELSVNWEAPLDEKYPTLAQVLSENGYLTAGFVANTEYCSDEFGLGRGFIHYEDYGTSPGDFVSSASLGRFIANNPDLRRRLNYYDFLGRKDAAQITGDFLRWLKASDKRPFFAFLNYYDAHDPYLPPFPYDTKFGPTQRDVLLVDEMMYANKPVPLPQEFVQAELNAYDSALAYIDNQLGVLISELEGLGELDNSLVIITSDHGEEFGEHGLFRHSNSLYMPTLSVPLSMIFPGTIPRGKVISNEVSLHDLPSTILELLELNVETRLPGKSLTRYWKELDSARETEGDYLLSEVNFAPRQPQWFPVSKGDMKSMIHHGYHYILNGDQSEELYRYEEDPWEQANLISEADYAQIIEGFRDALKDMIV